MDSRVKKSLGIVSTGLALALMALLLLCLPGLAQTRPPAEPAGLLDAPPVHVYPQLFPERGRAGR